MSQISSCAILTSCLHNRIQNLRYIRPGHVVVDNNHSDSGRDVIVLDRGFWLADTLCTQALWESVMGVNPSFFKSEIRPAEQVLLKDVRLFLQTFSSSHCDLQLRLPSEPEWEYACLAGLPFGLDAHGLESVRSIGSTQSVKSSNPNRFGVYDLIGNLWEICDPIDRRLVVVRGGSWNTLGLPPMQRRLHRDADNTIGFRFAIDD